MTAARTRRSSSCALALAAGAFLLGLLVNWSVGAAPPDDDELFKDPFLVEYKLVHEEVDGGADSGVSPDGQWISFSHAKNGNREIYAVNTESGAVKNLTDSPADEWEARWSPDGKHIVFVSTRNDSQGVYVRNLETDEITTVIATEDYEDYPSFSHDGKKVTFTGGLRGYREVHTWDWETGEVKPITRGHKLVGSTSFSPDGSKIVYHAYYDSYASEKSDIWVVDSRGGRGVNITGNDDVWVYKAQWSHDGNWIVFSGRYDSPKFNLWVMRPDGTERRRITDVQGADLRWADWTSDGRLAWHETKPQEGRLMALDTTTGEAHELARHEGYVRSLASSPDGSQLAYEADGLIFVLDAAPRAEPRMVAQGIEPRFSGDGETVTFTRGRRQKVGMVPAAGGEGIEIEMDQPLRDWPAAQSNPWSRDGGSMVVVAAGDNGEELMLVMADGRKVTLTSDGHPKGGATWSADGRHVFYMENRPNRVRYYITNHSVTDQLSRVVATEAAGEGQ